MVYAPDFDRLGASFAKPFAPNRKRGNDVNTETIRDSRGKGNNGDTGWNTCPKHAKGKNLRTSGKPAGFAAPRQGTATNRAAFQKRLDALKIGNPEQYARIMRQATASK